MKGTAIDFKETRQMLSFTILVCVFHIYGTYLQVAEKTEKSLTQIGGKRGSPECCLEEGPCMVLDTEELAR